MRARNPLTRASTMPKRIWKYTSYHDSFLWFHEYLWPFFFFYDYLFFTLTNAPKQKLYKYKQFITLSLVLLTICVLWPEFERPGNIQVTPLAKSSTSVMHKYSIEKLSRTCSGQVYLKLGSLIATSHVLWIYYLTILGIIILWLRRLHMMKRVKKNYSRSRHWSSKPSRTLLG